MFAALVVTQTNLGASWKAALYRTIGSACGAVAAALLIPVLGKGPVGVGVVLFLLASGLILSLKDRETGSGR